MEMAPWIPSIWLGLKRNAENIHYTVTDRASGKILWEQDTGFVPKTYYSENAGTVLYAGISSAEALSYEWLFASTRMKKATLSMTGITACWKRIPGRYSGRGNARVPNRQPQRQRYDIF